MPPRLKIPLLDDPKASLLWFGAAHSDDAPAMAHLIAQGADVDARAGAENQGSPTAASLCATLGNAECLAALLKAGCDADKADLEGNRFAPLHAACHQAQFACAKLLVEAGADIEARDVRGRTPAMLSAMVGDSPTLALLIAAGCRLDLADHDGRDAVEHACVHGRGETLAQLLDAGASIGSNARAKGHFLMHAAVYTGNLRCVVLLASHGYPVDEPDGMGLTPAMGAAHRGSLDLLALLDSRGADMGRVDHQQQSVCDYARIGGHASCIDFVESRLERLALEQSAPHPASAAAKPPRL